MPGCHGVGGKRRAWRLRAGSTLRANVPDPPNWRHRVSRGPTSDTRKINSVLEPLPHRPGERKTRADDGLRVGCVSRRGSPNGRCARPEAENFSRPPQRTRTTTYPHDSFPMADSCPPEWPTCPPAHEPADEARRPCALAPRTFYRRLRETWTKPSLHRGSWPPSRRPKPLEVIFLQASTTLAHGQIQ